MTDDAPMAGAIDVVIVNWNSGGDLARCLRSLARNAGARLLAGIVVVDNGSEDSSAAVTAEPGLKLTIDLVGRNLGFAAASNRGAALGAAPYILFLNPDTVVHDGALEAALGAFGPDVGLVGLRQLDASGRTRRSCSHFPTPLAFWLRALGLDRLRSLARYAPFMWAWPHETSHVVDQLMGACLFMPRALFGMLGGFDERFFLYYEDVDLALRAHRLGCGSWFEAGGTVTHIGGGASRNIPARRLCLSLASRLTYARKHFTVVGVASVVLCTVLVEPWTRLVAAAFRHGPVAMRDVIAGYALLLRHRSARP
jgi:N-acetylglucosaminyl-diphospho-decaprenol L-rhamnosyltransferase